MTADGAAPAYLENKTSAEIAIGDAARLACTRSPIPSTHTAAPCSVIASMSFAA